MKNIILVTGLIADIKLTLIHAPHDKFTARCIPRPDDIISDGAFLLDEVDWDHEVNQGLNHMHTENGILLNTYPARSKDYDFVNQA